LVAWNLQPLKPLQGVVEVTMPVLCIALLDVAQLLSQALEAVKSEQATEEAVEDEPLL